MNQHQKAVQKEDDGDSRKKEKPLNEVFKISNSQSFQRKTHVQKEIPLPSKLLGHAYD